jgi:hypothetical protein
MTTRTGKMNLHTMVGRTNVLLTTPVAVFTTVLMVNPLRINPKPSVRTTQVLGLCMTRSEMPSFPQNLILHGFLTQTPVFGKLQ